KLYIFFPLFSTAVPTFKQNLQACRFVDAGKQLITREDRLFELKQDGIGSKMKLVEEEEDSEARLAKDYEDWMESVMQTLENSLDLQSLEEQELLKGAVQAILQEEEQDMRWKGFQEKERPSWRPRRCKQNHEALLERLVQRRMEEAQSDSSVEIHSSLQQSIICNAKRLKEDLLKVVTWVSSCYPEQENVCQFYATLYHKTFSARLREVAEYTLCDKDCILLLQWVNQDYPNKIVKNLKILKTQRLTELSTCLHKILDREETAWKEGELPQLRDQVYCCDQAIDIIEVIKKGKICTSKYFTQIIIINSVPSHSYKTFHDKVMRSRQTNTEAVLMVNLSCLIQCRCMDYITKNAHLFPEDIKTDCLSLLATMTESSHCYFTSNMHRELKVKATFCYFHYYELLGGMHKEFLAEYVRKMMKQKIKLSNKAQQQMAASSLCINSECIHTYFTAAGSNLDWLKDILPNLAGLLQLQDPDSIKLELVTLMKLYPDLSERHISAWLRLKGNLSPSDLKMILKSVTCSQNQFSEKQDALQFSRSFFSTVRIK
uniref:Tumor necrosis factor, alpha-induced protein 2b n=1 Tax=Sinocyclocheilus rhinocerous TaxID=307959 RepID=A0A673L7A5_9TELE